MTSPEALSPTRAQLDALRRTFTGDIIPPDHSGYDDARRVWNATFDRRPALVVRPTTVDDVRTAIRFGRDRDLEIAVRGGHAGRVKAPEGYAWIAGEPSRERPWTTVARKAVARAGG